MRSIATTTTAAALALLLIVSLREPDACAGLRWTIADDPSSACHVFDAAVGVVPVGDANKCATKCEYLHHRAAAAGSDDRRLSEVSEVLAGEQLSEVLPLKVIEEACKYASGMLPRYCDG